MRHKRYSDSYSRDEAVAMGALFNVLLCGGDTSGLMRSEVARSLAAKAVRMAAKARVSPPRVKRAPKPKPMPRIKLDPEARRLRRLERERKRMAVIWARRKAERAARNAFKLPVAERFRPTPYVFSEKELTQLCGLRGIFSDKEVAAYFGVTEHPLRDARRKWLARNQYASGVAEAAE